MKNITTTALAVALLFGTIGVNAQSALSEEIATKRTCATMEVEAEMRAANPEMGTLEDFEGWLADKIATRNSQKNASVVYTIPIVFHIIHNGENEGSGSNISAAQINSQITVLNEDFRKIMGTNGHNTHPAGADTEIEFCAALIDPSNNLMSEPGINRVNRNTAGFTSPPYNSTSYINSTIKPATSWNPDNYFNVWVLNLGGGLLGYAQFPSNSTLAGLNTNGGSAATDGVVVGHRYTGTVPHNPFGGQYAYGRTLTHEVGHCLGLRHIWGDGGCSASDYCNDTPDSDGPNYNCGTFTNCGSVDMDENYMDYTNDLCMDIFTNDQKTRMRTVMENSIRRNSLLTSTVCQPPAAPVANFTTADTVVCVGSSITFLDLSTSFPGSYAWYFGGGTIVDSAFVANPVVTFDSVGVFSITLVTSNAAGSDTLTKTAYIRTVGNAGFDFSSVTFTNETCAGDDDGTIDLIGTGGNGSYQYSIDGTNFQTGQAFTNLGAGVYNITMMDSLGCSVDTSITLTAFPSPNLVTSALNAVSCKDSCNGSITVIINGGTAPFNITSSSGGSSTTITGLCAGSETITVTDANGCTDVLTLTVSEPNALLGNATVGPDNGTGNGFINFAPTGGSPPYTYYIDGNVVTGSNTGLTAGTYALQVIDNKGCVYTETVTVGSNVSIQEVLLAQVKLYPNPVTEQLQLELPLFLDLNQVRVYNALGALVMQLDASELDTKIDFSNLEQGIYIVTLEAGDFVQNRRIIKQ